VESAAGPLSDHFARASRPGRDVPTTSAADLPHLMETTLLDYQRLSGSRLSRPPIPSEAYRTAPLGLAAEHTKDPGPTKLPFMQLSRLLHSQSELHGHKAG